MSLNRYTAFHLACYKGHSKIVALLIQKSTELNINLDARDNDGYTPFHLAVEDNHVDICKMIMSNLKGKSKF